jgi:hypothetical protein
MAYTIMFTTSGARGARSDLYAIFPTNTLRDFQPVIPGRYAIERAGHHPALP